MKRLLSLSTLYPNAQNPRFGTFVARSLEALAAREDWDVTVINPIGIPPIAFGKYAALKNAAIDGTENRVAVHRPTFPLVPKFGGRFNPAFIARAVLPLAAKLHAERPFDMLDAQFFYPDGPAAARIAKELGLPFSIKARGADIHYWGAKSYGRTAMLEAGEASAGMLAVCNALKQDMTALGLPADKISLHYTGLDRDRFRPLDHTQLRNRLGQEFGIAIGEDDALLATTGALIPRKGQEFVIGALAQLPDARLLLVGKGEDDAKLRALADELGVADRVHFLGSVDHDLLPIILSASDAMVLPSSSEGLANAWVEALACGTPLVITDAGGAREVVTSPAAGVIVERSAVAVAAGIEKLLAAPPSSEDVAAMAERFSWTNNAATLAEHYNSILEA
ncbi:glycosyltransferase [Altererythrobacter sp. ZODW24]|uniref:glycosyltransferase n=1 Tax=Altererythrobacter sp. ZODW24 TaxID=2185142 RepID=UPI000DF7CC95|nr:glycosyltransferase [Altererythrobacter sp. ZODW24]